MPTDTASAEDLIARARAAHDADRPAQALRLIEASEIDPAKAPPEVLAMAASCHARRGAFDRAEACYAAARGRAPNDALLLARLGHFYLDWERPDASLAAFKEAHRIDPDAPGALGGLSFFTPSEVGFDLVAAIDAVLERLGPEAGDTALTLAFARARALDKAGAVDAAWDAVLAANRAYREARNIAMMPAGGFPRQLPAGWEGHMESPPAPQDGPRLVVIGGMPRAGKSSAEGLLATLPGVKRGYETNLLRECIDDLNAEIGMDLVSGLEALPVGYLAEFQAIFARKLAERAEGRDVYTLTSPASSLMRIIPVLIRAVPSVRLILVGRDDYDCAWRIFQYCYAQAGHGYSYFLGGIMGQIDLWRSAVSHWTQAQPDRCMAIAYEGMIDDPAETLSRMARFIGIAEPAIVPPRLPDDRSCAAPYREMMDRALSEGD